MAAKEMEIAPKYCFLFACHASDAQFSHVKVASLISDRNYKDRKDEKLIEIIQRNVT